MYTRRVRITRESSKVLVEFLDVWGSGASLVLFLLSAATYLLTYLGVLHGRVGEAGAAITDKICYGGAVAAGIIRLAQWIKKVSQTPVQYEDPTRSVPDIDDSETRGPVFTSRLGFGYPKFRFFVPDEDDLEFFVEASEDDPNIADASGLNEEARTLLYESWYSIDPRFFLVMERKKTVGAVWEIVALSIILKLPSKTVTMLKSKKLTVVGIRPKHLRCEAERDATLLYDTLIFTEDFRKDVSDFKRWHTLFHFSRFEAPTMEQRVSVLIEPDNPRLKVSLRNRGKYGRHKTFRLRSGRGIFPYFFGHKVHVFELPRPQIDNTRIAEFVYYWRRIREKNLVFPIGRASGS